MTVDELTWHFCLLSESAQAGAKDEDTDHKKFAEKVLESVFSDDDDVKVVDANAMAELDGPDKGRTSSMNNKDYKNILTPNYLIKFN